jgi:hypothetical protein
MVASKINTPKYNNSSTKWKKYPSSIKYKISPSKTLSSPKYLILIPYSLPHAGRMTSLKTFAKIRKKN